MRKFLFVFTLLALFACKSNSEPEIVEQGRKSYMRYFNKTLKDPGSLVIHNERYELDEKGKKVSWTVDYGAKNSFGGMVRNTIHFESGLHGMFLKVEGKDADHILYSN